MADADVEWLLPPHAAASPGKRTQEARMTTKQGEVFMDPGESTNGTTEGRVNGPAARCGTASRGPFLTCSIASR
jgi:hypothetical protein